MQENNNSGAQGGQSGSGSSGSGTQQGTAAA